MYRNDEKEPDEAKHCDLRTTKTEHEAIFFNRPLKNCCSLEEVKQRTSLQISSKL